MAIVVARRPFPTLRVLLVALIGIALILVAAPPVHADVTRKDVPRASQVKASMAGKGTWVRSLGDPNFKALGAFPAGCRSDLPFRKATEFRNAYYFGPIAGTQKYQGTTEVTVYRFRTGRAAAQSLNRLQRFLAACHAAQEWVCEQCDGIATYIRTPVASNRKGRDWVAWNERSIGMGIANGRAIAARTGATIVVSVVSHKTDPVRMKTPPAPTWQRAISVARKAVKASQ